MAFIIPDNLRSRRDVPNAMRRTASAFQVGLDEGVTVWYEPPFDPTGRRPHYVVFFPDMGIAVLEVLQVRASGLLGVLRGKIRIQRDGKETEADNPLARADDFAGLLRERIEAEPRIPDGKVEVSSGAVLSTVSRDEARKKRLGSVLDLDRCLFSEDLDRALEGTGEDRLMKAFARILGPPLAEDLSDREVKIIHGLIQPETVIGNITESPSASQLTVFKPPTGDDFIRVMDRRQEAMAKSLGEGHRVIRGVAGSGKTLILIYRARLMSRILPQGRILVTCFTRSLAAQLRVLLSGLENVDVINLDRIMSETIRSVALPFPGYDRDDSGREVAKVALEALNLGGGPRYQAVLLDEAQDYGTEALQFVVGLLDHGADDLLVVADAAQNIFRRKFSWRQAGIQAQGRTRILRVNYRNTREILEFAMRFLLGSSDAESEEAADFEDENTVILPEAATRTGPRPALHIVDNTQAEVDTAVDEAEKLLAGSSEPKQVGVLYPSRSDRGVNRAETFLDEMSKRGHEVFWLSDPHHQSAREEFVETECPLVLSSIHSAKGLEFPHIIMCGVWVDREDEEANRMLAYVGMTRAMESLVVVSRKGHPFEKDLHQAATSKASESKAVPLKTERPTSAGSKPERVGERWTDSEDKHLLRSYDEGVSIEEMAASHRRSRGAIRSRLVRLGRIDQRGRPL